MAINGLAKKTAYNERGSEYAKREQTVFINSRSPQISWRACCLAMLGCLSIQVFIPLTSAIAQQVLIERPRIETSDQGVLIKKDANSSEAILKYRGIEPTAESIGEFLRSLQPDHPSQAKLAEESRRLINELGSDNYRQRRHAREVLGKMTNLPISELNRARQSIDPEVRASAAMLLEYSKKRSNRDSPDGITRAVCDVIVEQRIAGLFDDLLATTELFDGDEPTLDRLYKAIVASAVDSEVDKLKQLVNDSRRQRRIAGIQGLARVQRQDCQAFLQQILSDKDDLVKLISARELANLGNRESIQALLELLESEQLPVRLQANRILLALTGENFKFYAFESDEKRSVAVAEWASWAKEKSANAELAFPLVETDVVLERILISDYSAGKLVELDWNGNEIWTHEVENPWGVQGLSNGHRLVGLYSQGSIVEFDAEGKEVRRIESIPGNPMGFCPLENGNLLVAASESGKILEYDNQGKLIWENEIGGRPTDIKILENGNMIVALMDQSRIVEVNREGERIREIETEASPLSVQVTSRGTFITAHSSLQAAVEYDLEGKEVNRIELDKSVTGAREMPNGDYVLATSDSVVRVRPDGTKVWTYENLTYCYNVSPY